jgi:membrane peptidoglycan carboxypeptidase
VADGAVRRAVQQLTRGVGDTMFLYADGAPWFRLDEQRHDVPLDQISADLQHAVVAVEDRRFYYHPASIRSALRARSCARAVGRAGASGGSSHAAARAHAVPVQ